MGVKDIKYCSNYIAFLSEGCNFDFFPAIFLFLLSDVIKYYVISFNHYLCLFKLRLKHRLYGDTSGNGLLQLFQKHK